MILFQQMIAFFIFMLIGFYMRKKSVLDEKGASALSWLIANVANPALILSGAMSGGGAIPAKDLLITLGTGIGLYASTVVIAYFIPIILRVPHREVGIYRNMTVFTNIGFMGYPLINALMGPKAVLYASVFIMPFHFLIYTYAIHNFEYYAGRETSKFSPKVLLNVGIIASLIAIALNFIQPTLPMFVTTTVTHLSNLTAALSMINIGSFVAGMKLKTLVTDRKLNLFSGLRMVLIPVAGTFIMKALIHDHQLLTIAMITLAAPTGSMAAIMANQHDPDSDLTVRGVALNTVLSVLTIPLVSLITGVGM